MQHNAPVIVLGSGLAGYSFVREWRKLDAETPALMITRDDGHSYSKPLLSTGLTKNKTADALSMADPGAMAQQLNLSIRNFTEVTAIDPASSCIYIGNEKLVYSKLILALGAHVNRLNFAGAALERVVSINDLMDYRRFRSLLPEKGHILIMGAGLIGCEYANDLLNTHHSVTLVDPSASPMKGLIPEEAGQRLAAGLTQAGACLKLGHHVHEINALENNQLCVTLNDGHKVLCDLVISAIGLRPEIRLAEAAGIQCHRGIVTNGYLETSAANIYALGDCAETCGDVRLYVLPLMASARALAKTIAGERTAVNFGIMPVATKTPACPVITVPPGRSEGTWQFEHSGELDLTGRFINTQGDVLGFVLTGAAISEKQKLVQELNTSQASAC
jgi:rubredoxin-NAD+ reductase